jgi:MoxR-like ATPase
LTVPREQLNANLTAVKDAALRSRKLAEQADNNKPKATTGTLATGVSPAAPAAVNAVANAAQQLAGQMEAIERQLDSVDGCVAGLNRPEA